MLKRYVLAALIATICASSLEGADADRTALLDAVKNGDIQEVRVLLRQRTDPNASEPDGASALHWAVHDDDLETTRLLIEAGANVRATSRGGVAPIAFAA